MTAKLELVGKTISGIVATPARENCPTRVWMLQFTDGTHVEFVSPSARRALGKLTGVQRARDGRSVNDLQMSLNVA